MRLRYIERGGVETRRERLPRHYGESLIVSWQGREFVCGAGTSDTVEFWRDLDDTETLYAYTYNLSMGYLGLEVIETEESFPHGDAPEYLTPSREFFTQTPEEVKDYGRPLDEMRSDNAIRYLVDSGYLG